MNTHCHRRIEYVCCDLVLHLFYWQYIAKTRFLQGADQEYAFDDRNVSTNGSLDATVSLNGSELLRFSYFDIDVLQNQNLHLLCKTTVLQIILQ